MKLNLKILIYLPIIFFFLPGFSFYLPGINKVYSFLYISIYIAILVMFYYERLNLIKFFLHIIKKTPLIFYFLFILFGILNTLFLINTGIISFNHILKVILFRYILGLAPFIIYFTSLLTKYISLEKFIKIFVIYLWINSILGIIAYIGRWYDISIINSIFDFFNNSRILTAKTICFGLGEQTSAVYFEKHRRLCGLFGEPGYLGQFIFLFLPFVYTFANTNFKILNNKQTNFLLKKTIIPLTWINLILTLSPINLVFSIIITLLYYFNAILKTLKKHCLFIISCILLILIYFLCFPLNLSNTYLARILNIITQVRSFDTLIIVEPNLATRLIYDINSIQLFFKHPLFGVGIDNIANCMVQQLQSSIVPLTVEIKQNLNIQMSSGQNLIITPIPCLYSSLTENGIFISLLFFIFIFKIYTYIYNNLIICQNYTYNYLMAKCIFYSLLCFIIEFFYEVTFMSSSFNLFISICIAYIYYLKIINGKEKNEKNCINR
jgi:hypothetical protein